jgi:ketosteroid isomerase-like protein
MKHIILTILLVSSIVYANAQTSDEEGLSNAVSDLAKAILDGDSATLRNLTDKKLVYGHSNGKMESQNEFVEALGTGKSDFKSMDISNQSITVRGKTGAVRHNLKGTVVDGGKEAQVNLGILMVWHRTKNGWKLLARQGFKL